MGTYSLDTQEKVSNVVDLALSANYRLFDSAHLYQNEKFFGQAFQDLLSKHNLNREDIFITTKFCEKPV